LARSRTWEMADGGRMGLNAGRSVADGGCSFTFMICGDRWREFKLHTHISASIWKTGIHHSMVLKRPSQTQLHILIMYTKLWKSGGHGHKWQLVVNLGLTVVVWMLAAVPLLKHCLSTVNHLQSIKNIVCFTGDPFFNGFWPWLSHKSLCDWPLRLLQSLNTTD